MSETIMEKDHSFVEKALQPMICCNYFEAGLVDSTNDPPIYYDPNRRSSLGAESLLEHDLCEENGNLEDGFEPVLLEAQLGLEYADDIFLLNRYKERANHPRRYIEEQPQITEHMRCTLINWLIKVNNELRFGPETIFIAVSLTDRFLDSTPIAQDCLQLLAVCGLFIAAKLEETNVPGISALVSLCGSTYKHHHFRRMETLLLSTLKFELHSPTSWFFVTYMMVKSSHLAPLDRRILNLSRYVIETCLGSYSISQFYPSEQGASAICFSSLIIYCPSYVYQSSSSEAAPYSVGLRSTDFDNIKEEEEDNLFDALGNLNASASSISWTFQNTFTLEELRKICVCYNMMKEYMKPFLHSYSSNLEPSRFTLGTVPLSKSQNDMKKINELHNLANEKNPSPKSPICHEEIVGSKKFIKEYSNFFLDKKKSVSKDDENPSAHNDLSNVIDLRTDQLMDDASESGRAGYGSGKGCNVT